MRIRKKLTIFEIYLSVSRIYNEKKTKNEKNVSKIRKKTKTKLRFY